MSLLIFFLKRFPTTIGSVRKLTVYKYPELGGKKKERKKKKRRGAGEWRQKRIAQCVASKGRRQVCPPPSLFCQERGLPPGLNPEAGSGRPPLKQIFCYRKKKLRRESGTDAEEREQPLACAAVGPVRCVEPRGPCWGGGGQDWQRGFSPLRPPPVCKVQMRHLHFGLKPEEGGGGGASEPAEGMGGASSSFLL